jgi:formylglycine-generating enzyme required for sulfatase activity
MAGAADGRVYVFGDGFDWGCFKGARSRRMNPAPEPVGLFPDDESVFGVRDLAGSVAEWTATWDGPRSRFAVRGGSYNSSEASSCRLAFRAFEEPKAAPPTVGFRVIVRTTDSVR